MFSEIETASITSRLPDGTVKSRIHRARAQLKALVERAMGKAPTQAMPVDADDAEDDEDSGSDS